MYIGSQITTQVITAVFAGGRKVTHLDIGIRIFSKIKVYH